jgi:short-subunit dehydrogenase
VRTALVTGASSGIGRAVAIALVGKGYRVLGTSRNPVAIADPVDGVEYVALDLTDEESIVDCAAAAGDVDVLVNNAGESQSGPFEELPREAVERLFQLNVIGQVRLTQLLVPGMRSRGHGRVVMVGSMLGSFPLAYRSSYCATKSAIKAFGTAMRAELSPYGVWVTTVEPGSVATGISERRTQYIADDSPHRAAYQTMLRHLNANEETGASAEAVAETVLEAIEAKRPKPLYARGSRAPLAFAMLRVLPRTRMEQLVHRNHGLSFDRR